MTIINLSEQVLNFCGSLAPEPRRKLRMALRGLENENGDFKSLEGALTGYLRLRSGPYRVVLARRVRRGRPEIDCIFAEHRALVYEIFTAAAMGPSGDTTPTPQPRPRKTLKSRGKRLRVSRKGRKG